MIKKKAQRIGIVGLGSIGRRHLRILKQIRPEIEIILVRSGIGKPCPEETYAKTTFSNIKDAINVNLDAVIISSPSPLHLSQATEIISKKIPVLIEKPLSHNLKGVNDLKELAKDLKVPVLVGYVLRYSSSLLFFHKQVLNKIAGKPISVNIECRSFLPNWRPKQDYRTSVSAQSVLGGGVLLELSHELDLANWLCGPFSNIESFIKNSGILEINVEDEANLKLLSSKKYPVNINLSFSSRDSVRKCTFQGTEGFLSWNGIENIITYKPNFGNIEQWFFSKELDQMYEEQLKHFLFCVERGDIPRVSLEEGINALSLVMAAKKSYKEKKTIKI